MIFSSVRSHVATVTQRIMVAAIALLMTACATTTGSDPFARSIRPVIVDGLDISFMGAVIERGFEELCMNPASMTSLAALWMNLKKLIRVCHSRSRMVVFLLI